MKSLAVDRLTKSFGPVQALKEVSFTVAPGEIFGFVGANGAGKSTTMRIILGVMSADSGTVRLGDRPITQAERTTIGYMPSERGLYPRMKVGEQLTYLARLHGLSARAAAASTARWAERLDIAHRLGDTVESLSLGNQQRVQLAAALVHEPQALVLDEPFSGLDPVAVDVMSEVLREKARGGAPVIFSSHQLELVQRLCDRVCMITSGQVQAMGSVTELRNSRGVSLIVGAPQAEPGWATAIPGVLGADYSNRAATVLRIDPATDTQPILAAALAHSPVYEFAVRQPDLTELFREVVAQ